MKFSNYLVRLVDEYNAANDVFFTIVAIDDMEAENTAKRLCRLLPGLWAISTINEV